MPQMSKAVSRAGVLCGCYIGLFMLSGVAGLIYESVWTHYLKLFLGHAAYAQTLVLCIFMGGMAEGAIATSPVVGRRTTGDLAIAQSAVPP
jgi:Na+/melibiose symporter-like transporter